MGLYRSDKLEKQRRRPSPALPVIVSMSPAGYPSARLLASKPGFRFTRRYQFTPEEKALPA